MAARTLPNGYLIVSLRRGGKRSNKYVHRMVLEAFVGPAPGPGHHGAHANGTKTDNRLENLRWATPAENNADKILHGTVNNGERNGGSRLTACQVKKIRAAFAAGEKSGIVASRYGISARHARKIRLGAKWKSDVANDGPPHVMALKRID
jgi:hypothetical protein